MEAEISSQAVGLASNTDFSIISLFIRADIIVKSVIIILIASSGGFLDELQGETIQEEVLVSIKTKLLVH